MSKKTTLIKITAFVLLVVVLLLINYQTFNEKETIVTKEEPIIIEKAVEENWELVIVLETKNISTNFRMSGPFGPNATWIVYDFTKYGYNLYTNSTRQSLISSDEYVAPNTLLHLIFENNRFVDFVVI